MAQVSIGNWEGDSPLGPSEQRYFYALRTDDEGNFILLEQISGLEQTVFK